MKIDGYKVRLFHVRGERFIQLDFPRTPYPTMRIPWGVPNKTRALRPYVEVLLAKRRLAE